MSYAISLWANSTYEHEQIILWDFYLSLFWLGALFQQTVVTDVCKGQGSPLFCVFKNRMTRTDHYYNIIPMAIMYKLGCLNVTSQNQSIISILR